MTRPSALLASLLFVVAACNDTSEDAAEGAAKDAQAAPEEKDAEPAVDDAVLKLGDAKLFEQGDVTHPLTIAADGTVSMQGKTVATFTADGKLTLPDGKVALQARPDGSVLVAGETSSMRLHETGGSVRTGGRATTLNFRSGGVLDINPPPANAALLMAHEGCDGDMARTCAMAMFAMLSGGASANSPTPEEPATAQ